MSRMLQVCLYNADPSASEVLLKQLKQLNFVRLVPEVSTPDELNSVLHEYEVNLVFFHLDPNSGPVIEVIDHTASRFPGLAMIAISEQTKPSDILAPMRAGCDQFVCKPIDPTDLATAVSRVANKRMLSRTQGRCICVTGAGGGSGSTTIACNLALEISRVTETIPAIVDFDLQFGDVALTFDCDSRYSLADLADTGSEPDREVLKSIINKLSCNVALLTRPKLVEDSEAVTPELTHEIIDLLTGMHENVVIDVPRRLDQRTFVAFRQADLILIVCQMVVPLVRNAKRYYDALIRAGIPENRVEIIINRVDSQTKRITVADVEEMLGKKVFATIPNDYDLVARSLDLGRPVAALDRKNPVRTAIRKMAQLIVTDASGENKASSNDKAQRKSLLGRLFD